MGRIAKIIFYAIVVLFIVYGVMYLIWGDKNPIQGAGVGLQLSYVLIGVAVLGVLTASVSHFIHNPRAGLGVLIGLVVFGVIALIGYSTSSGEILESYYNYGVDSKGQSKMIDAELFVMYGLGVLAVLAIVASEISAAIKK